MTGSKFETNLQWKSFYKIAAMAALLIVLAGLVDTITSMMAPEVKDPGTFSIVEWFTLFQAQAFYAFSYLGIINFITLSLGVPLYLALYHVLRQDQPASAALAAILFWMGTAIYISRNSVFSMFALSSQYAAAAEAQKPLLEAAGRAVLAQGADLTAATFMGFFFTQAAGILITLVMLRGGLFSRWTAGLGLAGFCLTSVFFVLSAFVPASFDMAMSVAMPGGLLLLAYHILLARKFLQLSK